NCSDTRALHTAIETVVAEERSLGAGPAGQLKPFRAVDPPPTHCRPRVDLEAGMGLDPRAPSCPTPWRRPILTPRRNARLALISQLTTVCGGARAGERAAARGHSPRTAPRACRSWRRRARRDR